MTFPPTWLVLGLGLLGPASWGTDIAPEPRVKVLREEIQKPYAGKKLRAGYLRCEYRIDPMGIDVREPRLSWVVESGQRGQRQTAYRVLVASSESVLKNNRGDLWDSGKVESRETIHVPYAGRALTSGQACHWKVRVWDRADRPSDWSSPAFWSMGLLEAADWQAEWIGYDQARKPPSEGLFLPPVPFLRTTFRVDEPIKRATLYATALGNVDMHLNGNRVSDEYFTPGWTDYSRRVYYRTWDVTRWIRRGPNALGALLSDGWYSGYLGFGKRRDHYGKRPRLGAQLILEMNDGSRRVVATGPHWKAITGPVREADFLMGEAYDARFALAGWDQPNYDDREWEPVVAGTDEVQPVLQAHPGPPVLPFAELTPLEITEPRPGLFVLNLGQNFAGVYRLKVSGKPGQVLTLRFAERLNPDGTLYTANLREARVTDTYICRGDGPEVWEPRFTFHGYQYAEITGLKNPPSRDTFTGIALSSDTPLVGRFACSDLTLNKLHSNIYWTQRANFIDLPTDCPQRDERLGWTGDAQIYVRTATLHTDVQAFFTKWLVDLQDGQRADGQFPMVAPVKVAGDDGGPAWADAGVICPWTIYLVYGDRHLLARHYPAMQKFIEFCRSRSAPDLRPPQNYHGFGDWLSIEADTPKDVIYTAYFAQSTRLTAQAAQALGKTDDAARYHALFARIKETFNRAYVSADGRVQGDTQTGYVLALAFDLLDGEKAGLAAQHLVADIERRGGHLSTGFIGTKDLMLVLAKIARNDVAYRLIHNDTFPSWGFSIRQGGTSIWEHWDGWTPEHGFKDPAMNSFAHYSFGAVYQWMVENIGGIQLAAPAYERILIQPDPNGNLTSAEVGLRSIRGLIATSWKRRDDILALDLTVPANTSASLRLPAKSAEDVTESGHPVTGADGVRWVGMENGWALLEVESGSYRFLTTLPANRP